MKGSSIMKNNTTPAASSGITNAAVEQLKKLHSAQSIERKDISLEKFLAKNGDDAGHATIAIGGLMSKFVPKYEKAETGQRGFFTMIYDTNGLKIGAFSNALYEFASFFYSKLPGYDPDGRFFKFNFVGGDTLIVDVSEVPLDGGRSTYNFEILSGVIEHNVDSIMDPASGGKMIGSTNVLAIPAPAAPETPAE
jgi:hypothetical protein